MGVERDADARARVLDHHRGRVDLHYPTGPVEELERVALVRSRSGSARDTAALVEEAHFLAGEEVDHVPIDRDPARSIERRPFLRRHRAREEVLGVAARDGLARRDAGRADA